MNLKTIEIFNSVNITQLDEKNLLSNRRDVKYIFHQDMMEEVLHACTDHYDILEIDGRRIFNYHTAYYDTSDFQMYYEHQRGKLERAKVRIRSYSDTGDCFIEVKIKNNKNNTLKYRIAGKELSDAREMIETHTHYQLDELIETIDISYKRITLVHKTKNEKLTLDFGLIMKNKNAVVDFPALIFAEVKTTQPHQTDFCRLMKALNIREGSISKYCLGIISHYPEMKQNNFKLSLNNITKTQANDAA